MLVVFAVKIKYIYAENMLGRPLARWSEKRCFTNWEDAELFINSYKADFVKKVKVKTKVF